LVQPAKPPSSAAFKQKPGSPPILGTAIVGKQDMFIFVDSYPDLTVWAATQTILDSDKAIELKDLFYEVSECSENKLWKFKPSS